MSSTCPPLPFPVSLHWPLYLLHVAGPLLAWQGWDQQGLRGGKGECFPSSWPQSGYGHSGPSPDPLGGNRKYVRLHVFWVLCLAPRLIRAIVWLPGMSLQGIDVLPGGRKEALLVFGGRVGGKL